MGISDLMNKPGSNPFLIDQRKPVVQSAMPGSRKDMMGGFDNGKRGPKDDNDKHQLRKTQGGRNKDQFAVMAKNIPKISEKELKDLFVEQGHKCMYSKVLADKK